jgi:hypothetical protein
MYCSSTSVRSSGSTPLASFAIFIFWLKYGIASLRTLPVARRVRKMVPREACSSCMHEPRQGSRSAIYGLTKEM